MMAKKVLKNHPKLPGVQVLLEDRALVVSVAAATECWGGNAEWEAC